MPDALAAFITARLNEQEAAAAAGADRARVLREVATWRAVVAQYEAGPPVYGREFRSGFNAALGFTLQAKAREFSDHPDWRPDGAWRITRTSSEIIRDALEKTEGGTDG